MKLADCPVRRALALIDGKWKPIILHFLKTGPGRHAQLRRHIPESSAKVLTEQLRQLERDGLIARKIHPTVPPKVEYSLSKKGRALKPALQALADFGTGLKSQ